MCLNLEEDAVKLIAEEDIVCYKYLAVVKIIPFSSIINAGVKTGDICTGIVKNKKIEGVINIVNSSVFLSTNNNALDGDGDPILGYKYSWRLDSKLKELIINKQNFGQKETFVTIDRNFPVEIGKTYTSKLCKIDNSITAGLHSFQKYFQINSFILVKCIIPKGSSYYIGEYDNEVSYASDTLTYIEIIKK